MKPKTSDALLAAINNKVNRVPEHETLARLLGEWDSGGEWYLVPDHPATVSGLTVNREILGGLFVESSVYVEEKEQSRVIYGFDPEDGRFFAFAVSAITARSDLEYGHYDKEADALRFSCTEYLGVKRLPVLYERTLSFVSSDAYDIQIRYPEFEPERQLGMVLQMRRSRLGE